MNASNIMEETQIQPNENPGVLLAKERERKGYSPDFVAGKLHLRVRIIELLEAGQFDLLPEEVFVKGYIRAYAKLLGISPEPLLRIFQKIPAPEKKIEKALWQQRKKESARKEQLIRLIPALVVLAALIIVGTWWQKSREKNITIAPPIALSTTSVVAPLAVDNVSTIAKLESMFKTDNKES